MENNEITVVKSPETICGYRVFNDAVQALEQLRLGETIARYEFGNSMYPLLKNGEYAIITPMVDNTEPIKVGDSVFCEVNGYLMTHMVVAISNTAKEGTMYLIGSSMLDLFGWTSNVYGIAKGTRIFEDYHQD